MRIHLNLSHKLVAGKSVSSYVQLCPTTCYMIAGISNKALAGGAACCHLPVHHAHF